jgi:hypothetical protein
VNVSVGLFFVIEKVFWIRIIFVGTEINFGRFYNLLGSLLLMRGNSHINAPVEIPKLLGKVSTAIDSSSHGDSPLGEFIIAEILFL